MDFRTAAIPPIARRLERAIRERKGSLLSAVRFTLARRVVLSEEKEEKELKEMRKVEDYVMDLRKDIDKRLGDLSEQMRPLRDRTAKRITERPLLALGVAFVVGVAIGVALSKSKD
jgi:ElaB/YqjD/DUF883 family membrane-anchored ribosome-binding protein